jgi:hypothetical protein
MKRKICWYNIISLLEWVLMIALITLMLMSWAEVAIKNLSPNPEYSWWNLIVFAYQFFA